MSNKLTLILSMFLMPIYLCGIAAQSASVGTSGGMTLIEAAGAKAPALGEAFSAVSDDISAMGYNPSSLSTLKSGQTSFLFQKGLAEDSYGQFMAGVPSAHGGLGLLIGYYNGGDLEILNSSNDVETVAAQKDLSVALGYSFKMRSVSFGVTGKYLSSELAETYKATAYAADLGLSFPINSRVRFGTAIQNFGTDLKFISEGDPLPRLARAGIAVSLFPKKFSTSLLMDAAYMMNEKEVRPAVGLETWFGPLAFRAGYKKGSDLEENFTLGTGFVLGPSSLDYSFGMADTLDSRHRVSLSFRFGTSASAPPLVLKSIPQTERPARLAFEIKDEELENAEKVEEQAVSPAAPAPRHTLGGTSNSGLGSARRVYIVKPGESLASIAKKVYGKTQAWKLIFNANKHVLADPESLEAGQKIVLP